MHSNQARFQAIIWNNHPNTKPYPCVLIIWMFHWNLCEIAGRFFYLDYELNLSNHVSYVYKRSPRQLNAVRRVAKYFFKEKKKRLPNKIIPCFCSIQF